MTDYRSKPDPKKQLAEATGGHIPISPMQDRIGKAAKQGMNKTEYAFRDLLLLRQIAGEIQWFAFQGMTLKLADDCRYTPDFDVLENGGIVFYEVKGFWRDDARVKIKVAARSFPWARFVAVQRIKGEWVYEEIKP